MVIFIVSELILDSITATVFWDPYSNSYGLNESEQSELCKAYCRVNNILVLITYVAQTLPPITFLISSVPHHSVSKPFFFFAHFWS